MASKTLDKAQLHGNIFLLTDNQQSFASAQIELLRAVQACGSISKAAKMAGISYKTAWDRIDAMNNMSAKPLVNRSTGGAKGGGTTLTELGVQVVEGFEALQKEHQLFLERIGDKLQSLNDVANFIRGESVKASARNQFVGIVKNIALGKVNAEVEVDIGVNQSVYSVVTMDSVNTLPIHVGDEVIVLVKAPTVMISTDVDLKTSARNCLTGVVSRVNEGTVNSEIILDLGEGKAICAIITDVSARELKLEQNIQASAIFTSTNVVLLKGR